MVRAPTRPCVSASGELLLPGPSSKLRFWPASLGGSLGVWLLGLGREGVAERFAEGVWKKAAAAGRFCEEAEEDVVPFVRAAVPFRGAFTEVEEEDWLPFGWEEVLGSAMKSLQRESRCLLILESLTGLLQAGQSMIIFGPFWGGLFLSLSSGGGCSRL